MADVTPILIKDLAAQTTLQDTDYFIVGGADAKKITVAQMKSALGINGLQEDVNELNTKISAVSGQIGVTKILHKEVNVQEWVDPFEGTRFGSAIIIMGTETDGAMFIVTKRLPAQCFVREIYNTGGYRCYRAENATETDRPILSLGRNGAWYTRDIIVMGSVS